MMTLRSVPRISARGVAQAGFIAGGEQATRGIRALCKAVTMEGTQD